MFRRLRRTVHVMPGLGLLLLAAAGWLAAPQTEGVRATYRPVRLAGPEVDIVPAGLERSPGGAADPYLDSVENPLVVPADATERVTWTGALSIPWAGLYAFGLETDQPATLDIGSRRVVEHPGSVTPLLVARSLLLDPGAYPVKIRSRAPRSGLKLAFVWQPPGERLSVVPPEVLGRMPVGAAPVRSIAPSPLTTRTLRLPLVHPGQLANPVFFRWSHQSAGIPAFPPLFDMEYSGNLGPGPFRPITVTGTGSLAIMVEPGGGLAAPGRGAAGGAGLASPPSVATAAISASAGFHPSPGEPTTVTVTATYGRVSIWQEALGGGTDSFKIEGTRGALTPAGVVPWPQVVRILWQVGLGFLVLSILRWTHPLTLRRTGCLLILAGGLFLSAHHHDLVPRPLETNDELIDHWAGHELLRGRAPMGWSDHKAYGDNPPFFYHGWALRRVRAFLDWPPWAFLPVGLVKAAVFCDHPLDVPLDVTRWIPILLSLLTTWLVYRLARETIGGTAVPLLAAALHASIPLIVATGRLVKGDAFLAALSTFALWKLHQASVKGRRWPLLLGLFALFWAVAVKQTGIAFAAGALLVSLRRRERGVAFMITLVTVLAVATYPAWGSLWDRGLHTRIQLEMSLKPVSFDRLLSVFAEGSIVERPFGRGWMLGLWLCLFIGATPGLEIVTLPLILYAGILMVTTWSTFGWYRLALFPGLCLAAARAFKRVYRLPQPVTVFFLLGTFVLPALALRFPLEGTPGRMAILGCLCLGLLGPILAWVRPGESTRRVARGTIVILAITTIGLGAAVTMHLPLIDQGIYQEHGSYHAPLQGPRDPGVPYRRIRWF